MAREKKSVITPFVNEGTAFMAKLSEHGCCVLKGLDSALDFEADLTRDIHKRSRFVVTVEFSHPDLSEPKPVIVVVTMRKRDAAKLRSRLQAATRWGREEIRVEFGEVRILVSSRGATLVAQTIEWEAVPVAKRPCVG